MGNSSSRIDKFYGNYEKSFERLETDVDRLKARAAARAHRKANLSRWTGAAVALAIAVSVGLIYQVQQQPHGTFSYQQHFNRIGAALALPAFAFLLHWVLLLLLSWIEGRDNRKLKALEAAKRSMIKELKDMSRFDRIKSLIDKFDPDVRHTQLPAMLSGPMHSAQLAQMSSMQQRPKQQQGGQVPGLLMKGSGQVAGAAALAMTGAGKAIMPLIDKVATSLISDNPMLVEDLRRAEYQLQDAEMRAFTAAQENYAVKLENLSLKQRLAELEQQLDLPPSFDVEALQEQMQQQQSAQPQLPWLPQQFSQAVGAPAQQQLIHPSVPDSVPGSNGDGSQAGAGPNSWPGNSRGWAGDGSGPQMQHSALSAPQTPVSAAAEGSSGGLERVSANSSAEGMGEGLQVGDGGGDGTPAAGACHN